jgi:hypothetical protein
LVGSRATIEKVDGWIRVIDKGIEHLHWLNLRMRVLSVAL